MFYDFNGRQFHDGFAALAAFISLGFCIDGLIHHYSVAMLALTFMQATTYCFHVFYLYNYIFYDFTGINRYKWYEYGISATAGAVAVIYSSEDPATNIVILLIVMSTVQQGLGYLIDDGIEHRPVLFYVNLEVILASLLQVIEFFLVGIYGNPPTALFSVYVIGWSFFGIFCSLHVAVIQSIQNGGSSSTISFFRDRYRDREWVESIYSVLGWTAKISVFTAEYVYLTEESRDLLDDATVTVGLFSLFAIMLTFVMKRSEVIPELL